MKNNFKIETFLHRDSCPIIDSWIDMDILIKICSQLLKDKNAYSDCQQLTGVLASSRTKLLLKTNRRASLIYEGDGIKIEEPILDFKNGGIASTMSRLRLNYNKFFYPPKDKEFFLYFVSIKNSHYKVGISCAEDKKNIINRLKTLKREVGCRYLIKLYKGTEQSIRDAEDKIKNEKRFSEFRNSPFIFSGSTEVFSEDVSLEKEFSDIVNGLNLYAEGLDISYVIKNLF